MVLMGSLWERCETLANILGALVFWSLLDSLREAINCFSSTIYSRIPKPIVFAVKGLRADASPKHQQSNIANLHKTIASQSTGGRTSANSLVYWVHFQMCMLFNQSTHQSALPSTYHQFFRDTDHSKLQSILCSVTVQLAYLG